MANRGNVTVSNDELLNQDNVSELGIQTHKPPVQPKYSTFQSRLETFSRWPKDHPQKPELLASAGFYYCGPNDQVKCFHCDIGLCLWEPTDNPWVEHAKWFPDCGFVALVKQKEFIDQCVRNAPVNESRSMERRVAPTFSEADIEQFMSSPIAIVALNCGVQPERIRKAIRTKLRQTGVPFNCPDNLIDAALNVQVNETPFSDPDTRPPREDSSSSARYPVNDAAMDRVTRMIIDFALNGENADRTSRTSSANSWISELPHEITDDENIEDQNGVDEVVHHVDEQTMDTEEQMKTNESQLELDDDNKILVHNNNSNISLEEENKLLRDARTCKICMDNEVNAVFLPCGHLVSCVVCATGLSQCPICRANIKGIVRTYLS